MKTQDHFPLHYCLENSLQTIIDGVLVNIKPVAARRKTIIINEVNPAIIIQSDHSKLLGVITNILQIILDHTKESCVTISAKIYSDVVLVHFKEFNLYHVSTLYNAFVQLQAEVEALPGYLGITSHHFKYTTIALTFTNLKKQNGSYTPLLRNNNAGIALKEDKNAK